MRSFRKTDYPELASWYFARNLNPPSEAMLAQTGWIEPGVAAGFLIRTDSTWAVLDGVVSNPLAPKTAAYAAIKSIMEVASATAKNEGYKELMAYANSRGIVLGALRHGWLQGPAVVMIGKDL